MNNCCATTRCMRGSRSYNLANVPTPPKEKNMAYVDGFLVPVPKKNAAKYKKLATEAGKVWMEHGAIGFVECVADDVKYGKTTSFPRGVKIKPGEQVWFSWIVYRSRRDRDRVNAKCM